MKFLNAAIIATLAFPIVARAQLEGVSYDWDEKKNKDGITISTSSVDGSSFKAVRSVMTIKGSVASLFALVEDVSACPDWAAFCKEAKLEKRISDTESYVYVYNDIPFPVSDRDVYAHVVWSIDPQTKRVSMTSSASKGGTEKTKAVRLENAVTQWHFTPNDDGSTQVENFAHIDPNGPTPAWITNMMLIDAPYKTMLKMREIIESNDYADALMPSFDEM